MLRSRITKAVLLFFGVIGVVVVLLLGVVFMLQYSPKAFEKTPIEEGAQADPTARANDTLSLVTWNLGYAGLDHTADFFMDGGQQVLPKNQDLVQSNLQAVTDWLYNNQSDIILLQEVDSRSKRTFNIDQVSTIRNRFPGYYHLRAINFKVFWIPYPFRQPLGQVESGLVSLVRYKPHRAIRHQLPGSYSWPVSAFHLKRCLQEIRIASPDGNDWIILHIHLSAFDKDGSLRRQQMNYLKKLMTELYQQGHHVIVGGDWNHALEGVDQHHFAYTDVTPAWFQRVPGDWTPVDWKWAFDKNIPSLRATNRPYKPGQNFLTSVDGFLLSPNVQLQSVKAFDLAFQHSDHQPILAKVSIAH